MYFFHYKIKYYDECENETRDAEGITCAKTTNYSDAIVNLERYYGKGEIECIMYLNCLTDDNGPIYLCLETDTDSFPF